MYLPCHQFLADTGLTQYQDRKRGLGDQRNLVSEALHRRAVPQQIHVASLLQQRTRDLMFLLNTCL